MTQNFKKILKYSLITLLIAIVAVALFFTYFIFINPTYTVEISDIDLKKDLPNDASKVTKINEDNFYNIIKSKNVDGFYIQVFSIARQCFGTVDSSIIYKLNEKYPNIHQMYISVDMNSENMDKAISMSLYKSNIKIPVYLLDNKIDAFDLENRKNLLDFYKFITKSKDTVIDNYPYGYILDKNGKVFCPVNHSDSYEDISKSLDSLLKNKNQ